MVSNEKWCRRIGLLDEGFLHQRNPELVRLTAVSAEDEPIHSILILDGRQPVVHRYLSPFAEVPEPKPELTWCNETSSIQHIANKRLVLPVEYSTYD